MQTANERVIDARGLEPPEPMERVMAVLPSLAPGQSLRLKLHREPYPLYAILDARGLRHETLALPDGSFDILIHRPTA